MPATQTRVAPELSHRAAQAVTAARPSFDRRGATWTEVLAHMYNAVDPGGVPSMPSDLIRAATSHADVAAAVGALVQTVVLESFQQQPDSTGGWVTVLPVPNFKDVTAFLADEAARIAPVPRGETAKDASFGLTSAQVKVERFGTTFVLSEEDMIDGRTVDVYQLALAELGRAAGNLKSDLVYSLLLSNPTLADDVALFHADRSNLGSDVLADTALDGAMAAIGNQVLQDADGDPIHLNNAARYLIVPPALTGLAKRLSRDMDNPIEVRTESRLSATGVVDPSLDVVVQGSATNWLLTGDAAIRPSIILAALNGKTEPRVRTTPLSQGQWGLQIDVSLSLAVAAIDYRGLYFSTGAGG